MGGENHWLFCVFWSTEVRDSPNAGLEDCGPVVTFVDLTADTNFVDDDAVIFGKGGVKGGKGFGSRGRFHLGGIRNTGYRPRRNLHDIGGVADGGGENVGGSRGEAVEDVGPDGGDRENDGQDPETDAEVDVCSFGHIVSIYFFPHPPAIAGIPLR